MQKQIFEYVMGAWLGILVSVPTVHVLLHGNIHVTELVQKSGSQICLDRNPFTYKKINKPQTYPSV